MVVVAAAAGTGNSSQASGEGNSSQTLEEEDCYNLATT